MRGILKIWFGSRSAGRFGLTLLLALLPVEALAEPIVTKARIGASPTKTRFVIDVSERITFRAFTLANPYRVVIDMPAVRWRLRPGYRTKGGYVSDFRYGLFRPGVSRVVLDVNTPVRIAKSFLLDPSGEFGHRLVIDLKRVSPQAFRSGRAAEPERPHRTRVPPPAKKPRRRDAKRVIVIDPGHGGVDPGTIAPSGVFEKQVVLAQARELRRVLKAARRYRVIMTRGRDIFVPLRRRIAIAREADADLFISLHADSIRDHRLRGGSVYTLSERASDKEAAALAARENKADVIAGIDLNVQSAEVANILIDLAQRKTMNESVMFAKLLTQELAKSVRLLRRSHRFAGFAVLKAPDVPSVLVELGYLSNRVDERLLRQAKHRTRMATAILRAVDAYFARQQVFKRP